MLIDRRTFRIPICLAAAVAAVKINRPVRLRLDRRVDISITGHRHPFRAHYKAAFDGQGAFSALDIQLWCNAGFSLDVSEAVLRLAMLHLGNVYRFPNVRCRGYLCKTHLPSNTGKKCLRHVSPMSLVGYV
jgi:xanthine dehydrogenase molybdopterin-binding subunit B